MIECYFCSKKVISFLSEHEQTLVFIKPDGVKNRLIGKIIDFFLNEEDMKISDIRMLKLPAELVDRHYHHLTSRPFYQKELKPYIMSGPIVAMIIAGRDVIQRVRNLVGVTDPKEAAPGTIRAMYGTSKGENVIHASESRDDAAAEIENFRKYFLRFGEITPEVINPEAEVIIQRLIRNIFTQQVK